MAKVSLTDRTIKTFTKPESGRIEIWDGSLPGFGLRVSSTGRRTWIVMYRKGGVLRRLTLGTYPTLGLADTRGAARDAMHDVAHGGDPATAKQTERRAETFADLAAEYVERHAKHKRSGKEDVRLLYGSSHKKRTGKTPHVPLVKRWGYYKAKDITRRDIRALLDEIVDRGSPIMANRTLAAVRKIFNFAIERDWLEWNPCHMVKRAAPERQRDRVLNEDEIRAVWTALDDEHHIIAALFRLRLLTAQRGGEVLSAAWTDMDLKSGWWTIPAARSKNGLAYRIPLAPQALKILKKLRAGGDSPWVFPSTRKTGPHINHAQKAIERIVERSKVDSRGHDLRRTAASLMVGAGVPRLVVSKILNHVETGVTTVYDRRSYDSEKRAALDF